ncbi:MAG: hypothetical protein ACI936_003389 [Paraglaciecola sp.]|jgi:hypothetical protein
MKNKLGNAHDLAVNAEDNLHNLSVMASSVYKAKQDCFQA